jgi:hypothetical protein
MSRRNNYSVKYQGCFFFFVAIQCDEKCSHYSPCVQTCPKQTCDNYIIHSKFNQLCSEDACVEGVLKLCFNLLSISITVFSHDNIKFLIYLLLIHFHVKLCSSISGIISVIFRIRLSYCFPLQSSFEALGSYFWYSPLK